MLSAVNSIVLSAVNSIVLQGAQALSFRLDTVLAACSVILVCNASIDDQLREEQVQHLAGIRGVGVRSPWSACSLPVAVGRLCFEAA